MVKRNTWICIVSVAGMMLLGLFFIVSRFMKGDEHRKHVSFVLQSQKVHIGDSLRVYRITKDSVYLQIVKP